jgi:hypothetical protein
MARPKYPSQDDWTVHMPASLLLDKSIPDTAKVTWAQLRWMSWGGLETPPFTAQEFETLTGTKEKTLYGHLRILRDRHASRWHRGNGSTFIVSFDCQLPESGQAAEFLEIENSGNPDDPIILDQASDRSEELKEIGVSGNREFSKSRKPTSPAGKPPPRFDAIFEAVARVTNNTPPDKDWTKLTDIKRGILNAASGQLRKVKATAEQIENFPKWFKQKQKDDYRLRRPLEPWDLPKMWTQYLGDQNGNGHGPTQTTSTDGKVSERVAAIQRQRAQQRTVDQNVPALRTGDLPGVSGDGLPEPAA